MTDDTRDSLQRLLRRSQVLRRLELIFEEEDIERLEPVELSTQAIVAIALSCFLLGLCIIAGLWRAFRHDTKERACSIFKPLRAQDGAVCSSSAYRQTVRCRLLKPTPTTIWGVGLRDDPSRKGAIEVCSLDEHGVARHHLRVGDVLISVDGRTPADAYAVTAQLNTLHGVASATKGPLLSVSRGVAGQAAVQCTEGMWSR